MLPVSPEGSVMVNDSINSERGSTEMLTCSAQGGPGNSFSWTDPGGQGVGVTAGVSIAVSDAAAGGSYICTVTNGAGSDAEAITINGMQGLIGFLL